MEDRIIHKNDADSAQVLADIIFGKRAQTFEEIRMRIFQRIVDTALYEGEDAARQLIHKIKCRLLQDREGW